LNQKATYALASQCNRGNFAHGHQPHMVSQVGHRARARVLPRPRGWRVGEILAIDQDLEPTFHQRGGEPVRTKGEFAAAPGFDPTRDMLPLHHEI
jgi:hypothetical protein